MFYLRLLGTPSLKDQNGVTPPSLGWGKPLALLALLAVRGEARRDEIVDLLWRDVDEGKARNAFRQALHRLRSALGEDIVPQDREVLRLVPGQGLTIDLRDFEAGVAAARIDTALESYRGDFLQGVALGEPAFDQWADQERMRLRARYRGALEQGIAGAQAAGRWETAIDLSRRLVDVAPLDENAARTAALARISAGRRTEARDILIQFASRLQAELGLPLSQELQAMLSRVDRMGDAAAPATGKTAQSQDAPLRFSGREAELSRLLALWRATSDDAGTVAVVEGDEGIGKSRLLAELVIHAKSLGRTTVLAGREYPGTAQLPFASIAEALRPLVRAAGVAGASRHLLAEASRLLPELRDSFDLPQLASIEDEASRLRFFEGVAALVDAAAYEQPVMILLEDLHHAAPSTLDLLTYLAGRLAGSAVMFVVTFRAGGGQFSARLRSLISTHRGGERAVSLALAPLDVAAARSAITDAAHDLPEPVRARVVESAEGVPARLVELLRRARGGDSLAQSPVPMRALWRERLQGLSSSHRRTFLVLALLGRPAGLDSLAAMAHLTEAGAAETVAILAADGLVIRQGSAVEAHPLAAEVGLETAGQASRAFLAGWIADALAADADAHPGELARFFAVAGRARETFESSRQAALGAMRVGAWSEAVQHLHVARSVAGENQIAEIEGLLAGLGAGKPRIAPAPERSPAGHRDSPAEVAATPTDATTWQQRWFPNWRILFGAALGTLVISAIVMGRAPARIARPSGDTLLVTEGEDGRTMRVSTGDLVGGFSLSAPIESREPVASWSDSLARLRPDLAPARARALSPSPDGRWVLVAVPRAGGLAGSDDDLFAISLDGSARVAIDTAAHRSVTEASWSPDGSRIAWVARVGDERQQEVFIGAANGAGAENVTRHPADDYHIAWSGDGDLLGFTSVRDGNPELYAFSVHEHRLWRLTRDPAQDDWARFSPSGRLVAFESTRGGEAGVYVMPALGGEAVRVGAGMALSVRDWRGGARRYLSRIRLDASPASSTDTILLRVTGLDQYGNPMNVGGAEFRVLDGDRASIVPGADSVSRLLIGRRTGLARIVVSAGGWRVDTVLVRLGTAAIVVADGSPAGEAWRLLGNPRPAPGPAGVLLNADADSESGLLSRDLAPLAPGLELAADFDRLDAPALQRASVSLAFVAPEQASVLDSIAPQFLRHVSAAWDGDARRMIFAVGREVHAEQAPTALDGPSLRFLVRIEADSTVSFHVDGALRWRSTVRVIDGRGARRVQAWIGGRSTGALRVTRARVALARVSSP